MTSTVFTYGGGELLMYIFNGVAMLTSGKCGVIATIAGSIGSVVVMATALFKDDAMAITKWAAWYMGALTLLFVPKTTILIHDVITQDKYPVKNVPLVLGEGSAAVSALGHYMTKQFETVFKLPGAMSYSKSGMIFGSRLMDDLNGLRIENADIRQNYKEFVSQCVFYDILLGGKYTFDDLMKTGDIWTLVKSKASPLRMFPYIDTNTRTGDFVTCKAGILELEKHWGKIVETAAIPLGQKYFGGSNNEAKLALLQGLDTSTQFLLNASRKTNDVLVQKLMVNVLREGFRYNAIKSNSVAAMQSFGADRAYMQHKSSGWISGELAAQTIPLLKTNLEAIAIGFFPMTMIVCLIAFGGWQVLLNYVRVLVWLNTWPILFAILNFIMTFAAAKMGQATIAHGADGLAWGSAHGLSELYNGIGAAAGLLSISIPHLSHYLLKGGEMACASLTSQFTGRMEGEATSAGSDIARGQYSWSQVNRNQAHQNNTGMYDYNTDMNARGGAQTVRDEYGGQLTTMSSGDNYLDNRGAGSNLRDHSNLNKTVSNALSQSAGNEMRTAKGEAQSYADSEAAVYRNSMDLARAYHEAKSQNKTFDASMQDHERKALENLYKHDQSFTTGTDKSEQVSVDDRAEIYGDISTGPMGKLLGLNAGGRVSASGSNKVDSTDKQNKAKNAMKADDIKNSVDIAKSYAKRVSGSNNNTQSANFARNVNSASEESQRHENRMHASLDKSKTLSDMARQERSDGMSSNINIDQDKYAWLTNKLNNGEISKTQYDSALSSQVTPEKLEYTKQFEKEMGSHMTNYFDEHGCNSEADIVKAYNHAKEKIKQVDGSDYQHRVLEDAGALAVKDVDNSTLENKVEKHLNKSEQEINTKGDHVKQEYEKTKKNVEKKQDENIAVNLAENTLKNIAKPAITAKNKVVEGLKSRAAGQIVDVAKFFIKDKK